MQAADPGLAIPQGAMPFWLAWLAATALETLWFLPQHPMLNRQVGQPAAPAVGAGLEQWQACPWKRTPPPQQTHTLCCNRGAVWKRCMQQARGLPDPLHCPVLGG